MAIGNLSFMTQNTESQVPSVFWELLSYDDKTEFLRLKTDFHLIQENSRDGRHPPLRQTLFLILNFLKRGSENVEFRSIISGICFGGAILCLNLRQLSSFIGCCKSSLESGFHELGFFGIRTKEKVKKCIETLLPSLIDEIHLQRQWIVLYSPMPWQRTGMIVNAPKLSIFHNCLCFPHKILPQINPQDLIGDFLGIGYFTLTPLETEDFDSQIIEDVMEEQFEDEISMIQHSFSGDDLMSLGETFLEDLNLPTTTTTNQQSFGGGMMEWRPFENGDISMTTAIFSEDESLFQNPLFQDL
jgi:hypothetical protein